MRETEIEETVCRWAEENGWLARKIAYPGRRGAPDRHFYGHGRIVIVEFKRRGLKPDPHQAREHERLAKAGHAVHIIDSVESGIDLLRRSA